MRRNTTPDHLILNQYLKAFVCANPQPTAPVPATNKCIKKKQQMHVLGTGRSPSPRHRAVPCTAKVDEKDVAISETNQGKNRSTCDVMLAGTRWCRDRATYSVVP